MIHPFLAVSCEDKLFINRNCQSSIILVWTRKVSGPLWYIMSDKTSKILFFLLLAFCFLPFVSPALALFAGLLLGFTVGNPYKKATSRISKYLLQMSVVGLGFGMNLFESLQSGKEGMLFTVVSVVLVLALGMLAGKLLGMRKNISYLIASGTAICGGSAIAAVAPIVGAEDDEISVSLGTVFMLNAIALFVFPPIGKMLGLTQEQFGIWAAIAIHDTSSVVGAGAAYGDIALQVATMVKLTRALWIIPLAVFTMFVFKSKTGRISIPWFILLFILAMVVNTYFNLPEQLASSIVYIAKLGMTVTLFLIGSGLSVASLKRVGAKPLVSGVLLWLFISVSSVLVILFG